MSARTPLARRVIAALLLVLLTACHSWQPTTVSPQGWTPEERPSSVRLALRGGARVTLENPTMRNDSIFGVTDAGVAGVASRDVRLFEVRRFSVKETIALGLGLTAVALLVPLFVFLANCDSGGSSGFGPC